MYSNFNSSDYSKFSFVKVEAYDDFLNNRIKSSDKQINDIKNNYWNNLKGE